jgi:OFA family oxalate/formate antiporter-like MFS transporter
MFGIGFLVVVVGLAQLLKVPPAGFVAEGAAKAGAKAHVAADEYTPGEVLRTWQFYVLWFLFLCGAGAGLMIISKLAKLVEVQANLKLGFLLVAVLAIGNGAGRICAGLLSDRIGRRATLLLCFLMQATSILLLSQATAENVLGSVPVLVILSMLIGANYGANLSVFPSITKDFYGLRMFGVNYGLVFTAWGIGGFLMSLYAGWIFDSTGAFAIADYTAASKLVLAAAASFLLKAPAKRGTV